MITTQHVSQDLMTYIAEIGMRLRTDRELNALSLDDMANLTGLDISTLIALEDGLYEGNVDAFFKVSLVNELYFREMSQESRNLFERLSQSSDDMSSDDFPILK